MRLGDGGREVVRVADRRGWLGVGFGGVEGGCEGEIAVHRICEAVGETDANYRLHRKNFTTLPLL